MARPGDDRQLGVVAPMRRPCGWPWPRTRCRARPPGPAPASPARPAGPTAAPARPVPSRRRPRPGRRRCWPAAPPSRPRCRGRRGEQRLGQPPGQERSRPFALQARRQRLVPGDAGGPLVGVLDARRWRPAARGRSTSSGWSSASRSSEPPAHRVAHVGRRPARRAASSAAASSKVAGDGAGAAVARAGRAHHLVVAGEDAGHRVPRAGAWVKPWSEHEPRPATRVGRIACLTVTPPARRRLERPTFCADPGRRVGPGRRDATPWWPPAPARRPWRWPWPATPGPGPRPPRRALAPPSSPSGSAWRRGGPPLVVLHHERDGGGRAPPRRGRGAPGRRPADRLHRRPAARAAATSAPPQTIDQTNLFGRAVRWFADPGADAQPAARGLLAVAAPPGPAPRRPAPPAGPVHLNLAFREPLVPRASRPAAAGRADGRPWHAPPPAAALRRRPVDRLAGRCGDTERGRGAWPAGARTRGGGRCASPRRRLARARRPRSRAARRGPHAVATLRRPAPGPGVAARHRPDVVLRLGGPPPRKVWPPVARRRDVVQILVDPRRRLARPRPHRLERAAADPGLRLAAVVAALGGRTEPAAAEWTAGWRRAEVAAQRAIADRPSPATRTRTEAGWPATLVRRPARRRRPWWWRRRCRSATSSGSLLPASGLRVLANRGANGIDGFVSTAFGVASRGRRPDRRPLSATSPSSTTQPASSSPPAAASTLTLVVVDNDGGGIFSFLPQAEPCPMPASRSCSAPPTASTWPPWPPPSAWRSTPSTAPRRLVPAVGRLSPPAARGSWSCAPATAPPTSPATVRPGRRWPRP